jgi:hypothetical protein
MRYLLAAFALSASLVSSSAAAQEPPPPPPQGPPPPAFTQPQTAAELEAWHRSMDHEVWYGWQTMLFDAGAFAWLLAWRAPVWPVVAVSVTSYALGPPIDHFAHGSAAKGLADLALRVALPLAGFGLARMIGGPQVDLGYEALGIAAGCVGASAFDAGVLGWDRWHGPAAIPRTATMGFATSF